MEEPGLITVKKKCLFEMALNKQVSKSKDVVTFFFGSLNRLGGGFKYFFYFHPYLGKISNLTNIFQMG